jgi:hypothetical protein
MRKKVKLLPALAFSVALVPMAEVGAIAVGAHHDITVSSPPRQHPSSMVETPMVQDPFSLSGQSVHAAGYELIMVNSTPVWASIH